MQNPQMDLQAMARCHRIGQTRPVVVYRFCTRGTIDEYIVERGDAKRMLEKALISMTINKDVVKELREMMETTDYKVVSSKQDGEKKFIKFGVFSIIVN